MSGDRWSRIVASHHDGALLVRNAEVSAPGRSQRVAEELRALAHSDGRNTMRTPFHPDPEIAAEIEADVRASEAYDMSVGFPPYRWTCDCGASHSRGHFLSIGVHRCLNCGYVGEGGSVVSFGGPVDQVSTVECHTSSTPPPPAQTRHNDGNEPGKERE